jgi:hypothetical protein
LAARGLGRPCSAIQSLQDSQMRKMRAAVFVEPCRIVLDDKSVRDVGPLDYSSDLRVLVGAWAAALSTRRSPPYAVGRGVKVTTTS